MNRLASARGEQPIGVLVQAAIAHLHEAEHALDDAEHLLDFRAHLRLGPVPRPLNLVDAFLEAIAPVDEVQRVGRMLTDYLGLPFVGLIAPYPRLVAMQQR